ncbi:MAG: hypothetical protein M3R23_02525 [Actinomycetota bacterium]|nr:hypothetical protein [Actinomycetota bacterium]
MRILRVANLAGPLCLAVLLVAGCGGSGSGGKVENRPAPAASSFPSSKGKTLYQVLKGEASAPTTLVLLPTQRVFYKGENRFGFGVFTRSARKQVANAQIALYVAKAPPPGALPKPNANGASAGKGPEGRLAVALGNPASGPYPAKIESLATEPAFSAKTTADDPDAGKVVYTTKINLPSNGEWRIGALIKDGDKLTASVLTSAMVGQFKDIPRVGQRPPDIHTPTPASVGGDLSKLTTRVPPERMNKVDFADVLGKKPIVLLFATPQFCESRTCGPVVDAAAQVQRDYGDKAEFIHMEIFNENDPSKGVRPQVRAFHLPSEPFLFVIDRKGVIRTEIEGAFNVQELTDAVKGVTGG